RATWSFHALHAGPTAAKCCVATIFTLVTRSQELSIQTLTTLSTLFTQVLLPEETAALAIARSRRGGTARRRTGCAFNCRKSATNYPNPGEEYFLLTKRRPVYAPAGTVAKTS